MGRAILIIDDDEQLCDLIEELLRPEGFELEAHHTGEAAAARATIGDSPPMRLCRADL
jgi:DNA-binding response OmpR family regulator